MLNPAPNSNRPEPDPGFPGDPVFAAGLRACVEGQPAVLAAIVGVQGSAPREVGARMLVTRRGIVGTVGGGVLEHMVIQRARSLLRRAEARHCLLSFPLGPDSQQCCGGVVTLFLEPLSRADHAWLERLKGDALRDGIGLMTRLGERGEKTLIDPAAPPATRPAGLETWLRRHSASSDAALFSNDDADYLCQYLVQAGFEVALFGAGHVGRALAAALAAHRCRLLWCDPRESEFPDSLPANARAVVSDDLHVAMRQVRAGSMVLVMTHRHPLDYEICRAVLERGDCAFLGLIGSASKRRHFIKTLLKGGVGEQAAERLCCPIGVPGLKSKEPQVIAASVVAQLLMLAENQHQAPPRKAIGVRERDAERSCVAASF